MKETRYTIKAISNKNDQTINIKKDDIVVFLGSNNVGKSKTLKEIYDKISNEWFYNNYIIKDIVIKGQNEENIFETITSHSKRTYGKNGGYDYSGFKFNINDSKIQKRTSGRWEPVNYFYGFLPTDKRLEYHIEVPYSINNNKKSYISLEKLSNVFSSCFGNSLMPDIFSSQTTFRIGKEIEIKKGLTKYNEIAQFFTDELQKIKAVEQQGDGVRAFVSILTNLFISRYSAIFIDEPELFLHPPHATAMGELISQITKGQQVFISTHSSSLIKGLIAKNNSRLKFIRITRELKDGVEINKFSILDNTQICNSISDPMLKHSNILDGIFAKRVILCESESDCKFYSNILSEIKTKKKLVKDEQFLYVSGKAKINKIASSLKSLNIPTICILDIDILENENMFKNILKTFNIEWSLIKKDYNIIKQSIENKIRDKLNKKEFTLKLEDIKSKNKSKYFSDQDITTIKELLKMNSPWQQLKHLGKSYIPAGDSSTSFNNIIKILNKNGIFIVENGELENFDKTTPGHGVDWVNNVFEKYGNEITSNLKDATEFVERWHDLYM